MEGLSERQPARPDQYANKDDAPNSPHAQSNGRFPGRLAPAPSQGGNGGVPGMRQACAAHFPGPPIVQFHSLDLTFS